MKKSKHLKNEYKSMVLGLQAATELVTFTVLYYVIWVFGYSGEHLPQYMGSGKYLLAFIYLVMCYVFITNIDGFQFGNLRRFDLCVAQWIGLFLTNFLTYFLLCLLANRMVDLLPMLILMGLQVLLALLLVFSHTALYFRLFKPHAMVMVYGSDNAVSMKIKMDERRDKYHIDRMISASEKLDRILQVVADYESVILNDVPTPIRNDLLKFCYKHQIRTYVVPKISDILLRGAHPISTFDTPLLLVRGYGLSMRNRIFKRIMDIAISLPVAVITAPIMLITAIAIKLEDGGPVFYKQRRVTLNGKEFDILKFRSMIVDAEKDGHSIPAQGHDPRITRVGRFIRASRIDELPQLLNILKGDMSIVGPRPERLEHMEKYSAEIPEFSYRLKVKGGLTGYAQIYGKYNTSPYDKLRLDLMYIENYSLVMDIKLILLTIRVLFSKESTEGFDEAAKREEQKEELLKELHEEEAASGAAK